MDLFDIIGSYGPWQRRVFCVFFYVNILAMWQTLSITFLAPNVDFRCIEPSPLLLPSSNDTFDDRCEVLVSNATSPEPCIRWEYDTVKFSHTIVSEWDLVCDRQWLVSLAKSVYMLGILTSILAIGQLSDWLGRYPTLVACYVITTTSMFLSLLSTSYSMFAGLRYFQAVGRTGLSTVGIVLVMELMGPGHRTRAGATIQFGWAVGFMTLSGIAWFFRHWFWFQLVLSFAFVPLGFAFWFVPESPRWLLMRGKTKRLERLLAEAVRVNRRESKVVLKDLDVMKVLGKENDKNTKTLFHLLKMPKMRNRIFIMFYLWMVNAFVYYGLSFNTNDIAGDSYVNFTIAGALEFPSYALLYLGSQKIGRRMTLFWLMMGGGAALFFTMVVPKSLPWLAMVLGMSGKFFVTASFGLLYIYTSELFPTVVRIVSIGSCSTCARVGSVISPFVRELGLYTHPSVPNILFGVLAVTSGLLALLLPETKGQNMPDTMEEGEAFGQSPSADDFVSKNSHQMHPMRPLLLQSAEDIKEIPSKESVQ